MPMRPASATRPLQTRRLQHAAQSGRPLGRAQARRIGERLRSEQVPVRAVWSSQWCRTLDTAELAALAPVREVAPSTPSSTDAAPKAAQTASARALLLAWRERGTLVVVTHQVNISALSGTSTTRPKAWCCSAEAMQLVVVGRIRPDALQRARALRRAQA